MEKNETNQANTILARKNIIKTTFKSNLLENLKTFEDVEVVNLKTEKLKLKNVIVNNTFNIIFKGDFNYQILENIQNQSTKLKKTVGKSDTFNIITPSLKKGDIIREKFIYLNGRIFILPTNKVNIILVFSRKFKFIFDKMEKFLNLLAKNNYISVLHISLDNILKDGLMEYNLDFLNFKRLFTIDKFPTAIVYDNKYKVIWTGDMNQLIEEPNLHETLFLQMTYFNKKNDEDASRIQVKLANLMSHNENEIEESNKVNYLKLKEKMDNMNRIDFKSMRFIIKNVEMKLRKIKKYLLNETNFVKKIYKPTLEYNEHAAIKDRTGKFVDELLIQFKDIMNFVGHEEEEDYRKWIVSGLEFYYKILLSPLQIDFSKMKLGLKSEESFGLFKRNLKYTIYNKTAFSDFIGLDVFFNYIIISIANHYSENGSNQELKKAATLKANFFAKNTHRKFVVPCFDENLVEKTIEEKEGEVTIVFLLTLFNPVFLQMFTSTIPILENLKTIYKDKKLPKFNITIAIFCSKIDISTIKSQFDFIDAKHFVNGLCDFVFVDHLSHLSNWMQFTNIEEIGGFVIDSKGRRFNYNSEQIVYMQKPFEELLLNPTTYTVDKSVYESLKEFGKKLIKVKLKDLDYNPSLYMAFNTDSSLSVKSTDNYEPFDTIYNVSFVSRVRRKDRGCLIPFVQKIKQIMKIEGEVDFFEDLSDVIDINLGTSCSKCHKILSGLNELQFYCYWCNLYFCDKCGNEYHQEEQDLKKRLPHEHYLVVIKVKNQKGMKNIDTYKFGHNIWEKFYQPNSILNTINCNGCDKKCMEAILRHICLTCRPGPIRGVDDQNDNSGFVDYCPDCIEAVLNGSWKDKPELIKGFAKDDHECDSHIYLRIDYQTGNYYVF